MLLTRFFRFAGGRVGRAKAEVGHASPGHALVLGHNRPKFHCVSTGPVIGIGVELFGVDGHSAALHNHRRGGVGAQVRHPVGNRGHARCPPTHVVVAVVPYPIGDGCGSVSPCAATGGLNHQDLGSSQHRHPADPESPELGGFETVTDTPQRAGPIRPVPPGQVVIHPNMMVPRAAQRRLLQP